MSFCRSITRYSRRESVEVRVGRTVIGGGTAIKAQSMANTDTNDTPASVAQALRIAAAGGELVRFTAQGRREAQNLANIKEGIRAAGCDVPLVADIHFNPEAAFIAAGIVEKVRINPGNFIDKRADFTQIEYTESEYAAELERLDTKFSAFLSECEAHGTAIRIGVNHGSLSDRIMSRYGDTPAGMVESAMEFLRVCRKRRFDRAVISMKSSNVRVMIYAYRMLSAAMAEEGMGFPLHLGVTEAGNGEEARVKSAVGIGALLADGLGDTVRVSLTEPPENEIPVAIKLISYFSGRENHTPIPGVDERFYSPYEYKKRFSIPSGNIGGENPPVVVVSGADRGTAPAPDYYGAGKGWMVMTIASLSPDTVRELKAEPKKVIVLDTENINGVAEQRAFFLRLAEYGVGNPVIIRRKYSENDLESLQLKAAADIGMLLADGFGDGVWIENNADNITPAEISSLSFAILQAARVRISRTEYIACPGCGRTLFDLEGTLEMIKRATSHLVGVKIAVMGCIVNGPGEMADADYGYVGAGPGRVTLYKGKEVVKRNIPQDEAIPELLNLIESARK